MLSVRKMIPLAERLSSRKQMVTAHGKDAEKEELLFTAVGKVNLYTHYGQYWNVSKLEMKFCTTQ